MKKLRSISLAAAFSVLAGLTLLPVPVNAQNVISTVVGGGPVPSSPLTADIAGPVSAVRDSAGNTYISAPLAAEILKITPGGVLSVFAGQGYGGFNGDNIPASSAVLGNPAGIAFDSQGNMYFADYGATRVRRIDAVTGMITTVAGNGTKCDISTNPCGDNGPATSALLNLPESVALDGAGNLYIADAVDNRIRMVAAVTNCWQSGNCTITTVVGSGTTCTNPSSACGDGGSATAAQLNYPEGVAVDAAGNIYVSDTLDQRVRIVSGGVINAFAGNGGYCRNPAATCGDGHPATLANLYRPQQLALDGSGNVYIADSFDYRVRMVDTTGVIHAFAGDGVQGFAGDGSAAIYAEMDLPVGVSVDVSGNVLVADTGNQCVRVVATNSSISTVAGRGNGGDGGPATSATLAGPYSVTEDANGNLYIADTGNNRIREVSNGTITTVAGTGSAGYSGDGGLATSAMLNQPFSVVVDSQGNIFFSDYGNLVVRRVDAVTHIITTYAGNGLPCSPTTAKCGDGGAATAGNLTSPWGLAIDGSDNLYIADYYAFRVRKVAGSSQIISTVAGTGNMGKAGDGGPATKANLNHPSGVALDPSGDLFIADQYNNKVREVNTSGIINTYMGNGKACLCGDGGPALNGSMWNPQNVATDPSGNVFVAGGNDNVVQRINATTGIWGTVAGNAAKPLVGGFAGDGGLATQATLANFGVTVDGGNNLYIADEGNNRIRTVHLTPAITVPTAPLNFGNVPINTQSGAKSVKVTSSGGVDLSMTGVSITGTNASNFKISTTTCPTNGLLGVDSTCLASVVFTPSFYGQAKALLTYTDNAPNSPQTVSLSGSGPDFSIAASPNTITVARGNNGTVNVTLSPIAGFNQTITLSCSGAPAATTCTPNPSSVTLDGTHNGSSQVAIAVGSTTAPGTYKLTVKGVFTPLQHPATITLTVQ